MANFSILKESEEEWWSPPFYALPGGYKMCLNIASGGCGAGKGTHISAYLYLMAGENDKNLEWPMRGTFSIELLNQKEIKITNSAQFASVKQEQMTSIEWSAKAMLQVVGDVVNL